MAELRIISELKEKKERPRSALNPRFAELREMSSGSFRRKSLNTQISSSQFDIRAIQKAMRRSDFPAPKPTKALNRRFSLPANLATYEHNPISPIVLPPREFKQKEEDNNQKNISQEQGLDEQVLAKGHPSPNGIKRSATSVNGLSKDSGIDTSKGSILRKKKLVHRTSSSNENSTRSSINFEYIESYFVCIRLPSGSYLTVQAGSHNTMEEVLQMAMKKKFFNLRQNELPGEKYTLEIPAEGDKPTINVEMDRPLGYYRNPKTLSITDKEKQYSAMYLNENGQDVMILKSLNGKFEVMATTKEKSVERLLDEEKIDRSFREIFLLAYRSFLTPQEFLDLLMKRYNARPPEDPTEEEMAFYEKALKTVRLNVFYVLKEWCKWYYHDFALNEVLKAKLQDFVSEIVPVLSAQDEIVRVQCAELNKLIQHRADIHSQVSHTIRELNRKTKGVESMIKVAKPREIAEQLCLWNQTLFKNINSVEFLNQIWSDPEEKEFHSPNLTFFIQRFEKESYWVATEICSTKDSSKRVSVLKRFIEICQECLNLNNLFSLFSFLAGLNLTPVQRLKKTWAALPSQTRKTYQKLEKMSDPSRNMLAYRTFMANCSPPVIPFLPIFLKDLIFFNDGNPSKIEGGLINFEKLRMMTEQIRALTLMAHVSYKFQEDAALQNYIRNPRTESLNTLIEVSNKLEPRK